MGSDTALSDLHKKAREQHLNPAVDPEKRVCFRCGGEHWPTKQEDDEYAYPCHKPARKLTAAQMKKANKQIEDMEKRLRERPCSLCNVRAPIENGRWCPQCVVLRAEKNIAELKADVHVDQERIEILQKVIKYARKNL